MLQSSPRFASREGKLATDSFIARKVFGSLVPCTYRRYKPQPESQEAQQDLKAFSATTTRTTATTPAAAATAATTTTTTTTTTTSPAAAAAAAAAAALLPMLGVKVYSLTSSEWFVSPRCATRRLPGITWPAGSADTHGFARSFCS